MLTMRHSVDFPYIRPELDALFHYAHEHDVEKGGRYDARSAAINVWSHHWANATAREASETTGTLLRNEAINPHQPWRGGQMAI